MLLTCQKDKFTLDEDICYLNGAYMSPFLKTVEEAGLAGILMKRNPHKISIDDFFGPIEVARKKFAQLIYANDASRIAIIPSVSYAMANVAQNINLEKGDEIVMIREQFPSNYYVWARKASEVGATIKMTQSVSGAAVNKELLELINPKTKLVTIPIVHWADGTLLDIKTITDKAQSYNGYVVVDGTQSIGALDFNIEEVPLDALIVASYKWCLGPYSLGAAYYGPRFDDGNPIEESWMAKVDSEDFKNLVNYKPKFQGGAKRYDVGETSNFVLIKMFIAAIDQLLIWTPTQIQEYCKDLTLDHLNSLREYGYIIESSEYRANHLFGLRLGPTMDMEKIKKTLIDNQVIVSYRGDAIRVSPNIYNTPEDIEKLYSALLKSIH